MTPPSHQDLELSFLQEQSFGPREKATFSKTKRKAFPVGNKNLTFGFHFLRERREGAAFSAPHVTPHKVLPSPLCLSCCEVDITGSASHVGKLRFRSLKQAETRANRELSRLSMCFPM
jgi:hypothetical protein